VLNTSSNNALIVKQKRGNMNTDNTRSISINGKVVQEIEEYIKENRKYNSIAEFVNEAARLRLAELKREA